MWTVTAHGLKPLGTLGQNRPLDAAEMNGASEIGGELINSQFGGELIYSLQNGQLMGN